jgi:Beta-lactamase enzyme family
MRTWPPVYPFALLLTTLVLTCGTPARSTEQGTAPTPGLTPGAAATADPTAEASPTPISCGFLTSANVAADFTDLLTALKKAIDSYPVEGAYAVAVTDLQSGETISVDGDVPQLSGCTINLFVLFQVAIDLEAGKYPLALVDEIVRDTTWSSNAVTARELYEVVGDGDATKGVRIVDDLIRNRLGIDGVVLDHPPSYPEDSLDLDFNNWVTPAAMNEALAALWRGEVVGPRYRDYLLEVLEDVKPGLNYLTAAVPKARVSHKNGFLVGDTGYIDNDSGIVRLTRGDREYAYAVSFFSQEVPTEYGDVVLGQRLGDLTYKTMLARYP